MAGPTRSFEFGRYLFGMASLVLGAITLAWRNESTGHSHYIVLAVAVGQLIGGALILIGRTAKSGALVLSLAYVVSSLLCLPQIFTAPLVYNSWGNFFEQLSLFSGAAIIYGRLAAVWPLAVINLLGRIFIGICSVSFALEQAFYIGPTASFVPKWIPPSQMFWAIATTVFFALAALALVANLKALLAARLLTVMITGFGLLVWVPLLSGHFHDHGTWSETAETFAIAGAVCILVDLLKESPLTASARIGNPEQRRMPGT